jgi:hypothetical protein
LRNFTKYPSSFVKFRSAIRNFVEFHEISRILFLEIQILYTLIALSQFLSFLRLLISLLTIENVKSESRRLKMASISPVGRRSGPWYDEEVSFPRFSYATATFNVCTAYTYFEALIFTGINFQCFDTFYRLVCQNAMT